MPFRNTLLSHRWLCVYCRRGSRHLLPVSASTMASRVRLSDDLTETDWRAHVSAACRSLNSNQVIALPTDTIYGIAGLAQSPEAISRIYDIKNRDMSNPIAICVGDVGDIKKWGKVTASPALLRWLLPGPVTVLFERTPALNPRLNPGTALVGVRVPDYGFVRDVVRECGHPIALTSANLSNTASTLSVQEFSGLWPQLAMVFDGGVLGKASEERAGSTVVDLSVEGHYTIIRQGSAFKETTEKLQEHGLKEVVRR